MYTQRVHKNYLSLPSTKNLPYSQPEAIKLNLNETHSTYKHRMLPLIVIELFLDLNAFLLTPFVACSPVDRQSTETFNSRIYTVLEY